jgi:hypothetical protein
MPPASHVHAEEEAEGGSTSGDGQVHGPGVVADGEAGGAHEGGELIDGGGRSELRAGSGGDDGASELLFTRAPGDDGSAAGGEEGASGGGEGLGRDAAPAEPTAGVDDGAGRASAGLEPGAKRLTERGSAEGQGLVGRAWQDGGEEVDALNGLAGGVGSRGDGEVVEVLNGPHARPDDEGARPEEPGDEGGGDGGGGPVGAVDDDVIALAAEGADAWGEGPEPEEPPVEGDDAVGVGVADEDAGDLGVDEDVDLGGMGKALEGAQEGCSEQRLTHTVVDAHEEDALGGGKGNAGLRTPTGAPEEGGGHQGECQLRPQLEPLVPDHRGADHSREDPRW